MKKSEQYHRDIYSGMVADELGKEGYFGRRYDSFGFWQWDGVKRQLICAEREDICAHDYLQAWKEGALVTPWVSASDWDYEERDSVVVMAALQGNVEKQLQRKYGQWPDVRDEGQVMQTQEQTDVWEQELLHYWQGIPVQEQPQRAEAMVWLCAEALRQKKLSYVQYNTLCSLLPDWQEKQLQQKSFYGFAWEERNKLYFYSNGYLPTAVANWQKRRASGELTGGVLTRIYPRDGKSIMEQKQEFQKFLAQVLDQTYWQLLRKLTDITGA